MNNDRYERIRAALAMGPTPGPWSPSYDQGLTRDIFTEQGKLPICMVRGVTYVGQEQYLANGHFIAACDPDTIRALLDERDALVAENARLRREPHPAITHCENCGCDWLDNGLNPIGCPYCKQPADVEVIFIDGVGAARSSVKSCHGGVQWIRVGNRVYWPLSEADAKRLQSACCGNGSFDGPTAHVGEGEQQ